MFDPRIGEGKIKNRVAAICAGLALFALLYPRAPVCRGAERQTGGPPPGEPDGTITYVQGDCRVKSEGGAYAPASVGREVFPSDTVKTGPGSEAEIALLDGSTVLVTGDTEITLSHSALGESRYTSVGLLLGRVRMMVGKLQKGGVFAVNTLTVTAGVRGTGFGAAVREDGAVLVDVEEGLVEVGRAGTRDETVEREEIAAGGAVAFSLEGEREEFGEKVDAGAWREKALRRIRENPGAVVRALLERERGIIEALKRQQSEADDSRREWEEFARKVRYLESRGLHEEEKALIEAGMEKIGRGLLFVMRARRNLTAIRSTLVLAARVEQTVGPRKAGELPSIEEMRREYAKIGFVIARLQDAETRLERVLAVLNRKYRSLT